MKFGRQKKSICFVLIITMLFLGMCFENTQTDSFFSVGSPTHCSSTIRSCEKTTLTKQIFAEEKLTQQECLTSIQQIARRIFNRATRGASPNLAFVDILPQISPIIYISSDCELSKESSSNTIIVSFMHQKDGKKS